MKYSGLKNPIKYRNQRDYRTLKALYPDVIAEFTGTKHNALDDAIHQAKHAVAIMRVHGQYSAKQIAHDMHALLSAQGSGVERLVSHTSDEKYRLDLELHNEDKNNAR